MFPWRPPFPSRSDSGFSRQLATGATCWRAAKGRWGASSAGPRPRAGEGQGSASACRWSQPLRSIPGDRGGIGDQLGSMCMRSCPPSGASLGIKCDQGPQRDWEPAWLCVCLEPSPLGSIPGDCGGLGTSLALCVHMDPPPREHPWGPRGIRDQPAFTYLLPPLPASGMGCTETALPWDPSCLPRLGTPQQNPVPSDARCDLR